MLQRNSLLSFSWSNSSTLPENLTKSSIHLNSVISSNTGENTFLINKCLKKHEYNQYVCFPQNFMQHILHTYIRSLVQAVMACHCQVASVMSDSVRPHGLQPTRLLCPRDSPGKDTGVGCHFLLQCMKVESESEVAQSCLTGVTPWTAAYQASPSMGFSRQEYWSGVPLPSPCHVLGFL